MQRRQYRPILLKSSVSSNGVGNGDTIFLDASYTVNRYEPAPLPYEQHKTETPRRVFSLATFCIHALVEHLEELSETVVEQAWPTRSMVESHALVADLLHTHPLLLSNTKESTTADELKTLDPRLWLLLHMLFSPSSFPPPLTQPRTLALSDPHLPILQHCPYLVTSNLNLLTVLALTSVKARRLITDETILLFKTLLHLSVLDLSHSKITSRGIKRLAATVQYSSNADEVGNGCFHLRILDIRSTGVDNEIFEQTGLHRWRLLCAIDIRGTRCTTLAATRFRLAWDPAPANTSKSPLFAPFTPVERARKLKAMLSRIHPGEGDYAILHINQSEYERVDAFKFLRRKENDEDEESMQSTSSKSYSFEFQPWRRPPSKSTINGAVLQQSEPLGAKPLQTTFPRSSSERVPMSLKRPREEVSAPAGPTIISSNTEQDYRRRRANPFAIQK